MYEREDLRDEEIINPDVEDDPFDEL